MPFKSWASYFCPLSSTSNVELPVSEIKLGCNQGEETYPVLTVLRFDGLPLRVDDVVIVLAVGFRFVGLRVSWIHKGTCSCQLTSLRGECNVRTFTVVFVTLFVC